MTSPPSLPDLPPVGIVIVNHNLREVLRETITSCLQVNYPGVRIVVVDNASRDGSQEMVRRDFPAVHLIANDPELGYARAANQGMEFLAPDHKYIFATTNDVVLDPDILRILVAAAEREPQAAVLGAKILFHDRPEIIWSAGGHISRWHGHSYHFGWECRDAPRYNQVRACAYVTGCGFLLRTAAVQRLGFLRSELVFYAEDADLCFRVREAGCKVLYIPAARMWHKTETTLAKDRARQLRYSTRNGLHLIQRHRAQFHPLCLAIHLGVVCPAKMLVFLLLLRWQNAVGIWRGIQDWRAGRFGFISD